MWQRRGEEAKNLRKTVRAGEKKGPPSSSRSSPRFTISVLAKRNNDNLISEGWIADKPSHHDHWHWGICYYLQAWYHCRTAGAKGKSTVHSANDVQGDPPPPILKDARQGGACYESGRLLQRSQTNSSWGWTSCELTIWQWIFYDWTKASRSPTAILSLEAGQWWDMLPLGRLEECMWLWLILSCTCCELM
jgi:hypothetical protein